MKRCPQCKRIEPDDALAFCRVDGTALLVEADAQSEVHTSLLPPTTNEGFRQPTATAVTGTQRTLPRAPELAKPKRLKAFALAIIGLSLVVLAFSLYYYRSHANSTAIDSIAVLPFVNQNHDPDTDYLSDGLAESLIYRLSQLPNLKVSPTSSVFRYKDKEADPIKAGNELGVSTVLFGRITQRGDSLIISAELVDVRNNKLLWGEQFDRKMSELLITQREIAKDIAENLRIRVSGQETALAKHYTESNEAYQYYLRGRSYWNKRTGENLKKAIEQFQQAADKDPTYALAYVGLADCYALLEEYAGLPSSENLPKARDAALRALQIDNSLAEAHASMGYIDLHSWQFAEADKEFKRAIELNPNYATAHQWYHVYYRILDRLDEAFAEIKRAQQLDPLSSIITINVGDLYALKGDLNSAIEEYKKIIDLDPSFPRAHAHLGLAYLRQGHQQEAIAELQKGVELSGRASELLSFLGYGYGAMGKRSEAMAVLKELEQRYAKRETPAVYLAAVYIGLGDKDQALAWLEKDFQTRTGMLIFSAFYVHFQSLRDDPRYLNLLRRIGLRS